MHFVKANLALYSSRFLYLYGNIVNYPMIYDVALLLVWGIDVTLHRIKYSFSLPLAFSLFLYSSSYSRITRSVFVCINIQAKPIITYYYIITGGINLIFCTAFAIPWRRIWMAMWCPLLYFVSYNLEMGL